MDIPCTVYLDVVPGDAEGQLKAVPRVVAEDGVDVDQGEPIPLAAGMTISYGPVLVQCQPAAAWESGATPTPSAGARSASRAKAAAAGSTKRAVAAAGR